MDGALDLLDDYAILVTDEQKLKTLQDFRDDVKSICGDFSAFLDRSQRNPIRGKIDQFKKIYIYDFYLPAHERYVGKRVDWDALDKITGHDLYKKLGLLKKLTCISSARFDELILSWNDLEQYKCLNPTLEETLRNNLRCQRCLFPSHKGKYLSIPEKIGRMEEDLQALYDSFEKSIVNEIRAYRDNIQYLENDADKKLVEGILKDQRLPARITQQMIQVINKLLKEIDVIDVDRDAFINAIFPNQEMTTIEELRKNFLSWLDGLKKEREESALRVKLGTKTKTGPQ